MDERAEGAKNLQDKARDLFARGKYREALLKFKSALTTRKAIGDESMIIEVRMWIILCCEALEEVSCVVLRLGGFMKKLMVFLSA